jgi:hypothetical protein
MKVHALGMEEKKMKKKKSLTQWLAVNRPMVFNNAMAGRQPPHNQLCARSTCSWTCPARLSENTMVNFDYLIAIDLQVRLKSSYARRSLPFDFPGKGTSRKHSKKKKIDHGSLFFLPLLSVKFLVVSLTHFFPTSFFQGEKQKEVGFIQKGRLGFL